MVPWADQPFPLNPTCKTLKPVAKKAETIFMADEMANAHNGLIRALNSMYLQAPYVSTANDIRDLLQYGIFWAGWIQHHHQGEETMFFPAVEKITGRKEMQVNVEQHHAFLPGMEELKTYCKEVMSQENSWDANKFTGVIDGFAPAMSKHLREEIDTLLALDDEDGVAVKEAFEEWDRHMREGDKAVLYPMVLGSCDCDYEGGNTWPPVPWFVNYLVHYLFEWKHASVWRFSPCTTWGKRRRLAFGPKE